MELILILLNDSRLIFRTNLSYLKKEFVRGEVVEGLWSKKLKVKSKV